MKKRKYNCICVVSIVTKIRILKQITTTPQIFSLPPGCIYSNKDKNFKANHNGLLNIISLIRLYL